MGVHSVAQVQRRTNPRTKVVWVWEGRFGRRAAVGVSGGVVAMRGGRQAKACVGGACVRKGTGG